jgi:myo-inositol catabolism protein IolS
MKKGDKMQFITLGKSDIQISRIIMGTWQAGKTMWTGIDDAETTKAMRVAFDAGITTFDTATVYGNGHSERIVGKALREVRDRVVIATKVFAHSLAHDKVIKACHTSLKDLGTDYIDLYQIHWPAGSFGSKKIPIEETMGALNKLKEQKKIRAIGVSNFSREQIEEASRYGQIDSHQPPYSYFGVTKKRMPFPIVFGIILPSWHTPQWPKAFSPVSSGRIIHLKKAIIGLKTVFFIRNIIHGFRKLWQSCAP